MPLGTPQIAIGLPSSDEDWHDLELVDDEQIPTLEQKGNRPLQPGSLSYRYWTVMIGMPGGTTETVRGRLLLSNGAAAAPPQAVSVQRGDHPTYLRITDSPESEVVAAGILSVQ